MSELFGKRKSKVSRSDVKQSIIKANAAGFEDDGLTESIITGLKAAEAIEDSGVSITNFEKWPDDKEDLKPGSYYVKENGSIVHYDGKKILEYSPKEQKFK